MLDYFAALLAITFIALAVIYDVRFRTVPWDIYRPKAAWLRAGMYFCCCYLLSYLSGGMDLLLESPAFSAAQLNDPNWVRYTLGLYAFILIAYAGVWSYFTPVFERQKNTLISALFGLLWGSSSGQLFLAVWLIVGKFG
ncbi:MAG: hypothetical protein WAU48_03520, partial [Gammaproteobacteria bacterium]